MVGVGVRQLSITGQQKLGAQTHVAKTGDRIVTLQPGLRRRH